MKKAKEWYVFPIPFVFLRRRDVVVELNRKPIQRQYRLRGHGRPEGGEIYIAGPLPAGGLVTIHRNTSVCEFRLPN